MLSYFKKQEDRVEISVHFKNGRIICDGLLDYEKESIARCMRENGVREAVIQTSITRR